MLWSFSQVKIFSAYKVLKINFDIYICYSQHPKWYSSFWVGLLKTGSRSTAQADFELMIPSQPSMSVSLREQAEILQGYL